MDRRHGHRRRTDCQRYISFNTLTGTFISPNDQALGTFNFGGVLPAAPTVTH